MPSAATPLPPEVQRVVAKCCAILGRDDPRSSASLETTAAFLVLQECGFDAPTAAAVIGQVGTGGSQGFDAGLDAVAVACGEVLIPPDITDEALEEILSAPAARLRYIFVQATGADPANPNTPSLNDKLNGFLGGIEIFFHGSSSNDRLNRQLSAWIGLRERIEELLRRQELDVPRSCQAHLVWPRAVRLDNIHETRIEAFRRAQARELQASAEACIFKFWDVNAFARLAQRAERRQILRVELRHFVQAPGAAPAQWHNGYLPAPLLLEAITTTSEEDGRRTVLRSVFFDNIRSYLGDSGGVNEDILKTLSTAEGRRGFHLRSNGIAVVAREAVRDGDMIELRDIQIVNGCQTSFAIYRAAGKLDASAMQDVLVPTRLIICSDETLIDEIILGLNRQAAVEELQIYSRRPYVVRLANVFAALGQQGPAKKLFFERRVNEHFSVANRNRVLSLQEILYAFNSCYGREPHNGQPGDLIKSINDRRLLADQHEPRFYYAASFMLYRLRETLEELARTAAGLNLKTRYRRFGARNQGLLATRLLTDRSLTVPPPCNLNGALAATYLEALLPVLHDTNFMRVICGQAVEIVEEAARTARYESGDKLGQSLQGPLSERATREAMTARVRELCGAGRRPG